MQKYTTEAVVLRNINYADSHKIYTLLTKDVGKLTAIARGVRKITSRRAGNLDTLNQIQVSLIQSDKGFNSISEVKTLRSNKDLKMNLRNSLTAQYISELIDRYIEPAHANPGVFMLLSTVLRWLDAKTYPPEVVELYFELNFLTNLGFGLSLDACSICAKPYSEAWGGYKFSFARGGFVCADCRSEGMPLSIEAAKLLVALNYGKAEMTGSSKIVSEVDHIVKEHLANSLNFKAKSKKVIAEIIKARI